MLSRFACITGSIERLSSIDSSSCSDKFRIHIVGSDINECVTSEMVFQEHSEPLINLLNTRGFLHISILYNGPNIPQCLVDFKLHFKMCGIDVSIEYDNRCYHEYSTPREETNSFRNEAMPCETPNIVIMFNAGIW
jgi:hypothetical protein